jgi:adenylate kinase
MRIVLLGPPASGKGTQGRRLSASLGLGYLSTGALLRENIEESTPLGLAAEPILARGGYLPNDLMCPILADWLGKNDSGKGWVLDGFPRSLPQAEFLDGWLSKNGAVLEAAVALEAPYDELLRRTRERVECPGCRWTGQRRELSAGGLCPKCGKPAAPRDDDDEGHFRNRHAEFTALTVPVIDFYRATHRLIPIPATGTMDETAAILLSHLNRPDSSLKVEI